MMKRHLGSTLAFVETKAEIREFLTSRRGRITPEQAGLPTYGARRVPGLRREEVAVLAGVSIQYYTRLERGDMSGASESVINYGVMRAWQAMHVLSPEGCFPFAKKRNGTVLGEGGGIYSFDSLLALLASFVKGNKATTAYDDIFAGP